MQYPLRKTMFQVWRVSLLVTLSFSVGISQETTWRPVDPGGEGWLMFASVHPASGHLYFSVDMSLALVKSTDQGETWVPIANPIPGTAYYVAGDPTEPNTIYMNQINNVYLNPEGVTRKSSGIWKSTDDGETWIHLYQSEEFGISRSQSGVVDPSDNQAIYWTAADMGVRKSLDGGYTWEDMSAGLPLEELRRPHRHCHILEIDHNSPLDQRRIYYPTNLGLFRYRAEKGDWQLVSGLPQSVCSDVEVCDRSTIYAAFPGSGLYRSLDGGESWNKLENGLGGKTPFQIEAADRWPDMVYVATFGNEGVYGSRDGGDSFKLLTHNRFNTGNNWPLNYRQTETVSGMIMFIDPNDPLTLYLDYAKKTHDGGESWQHYGTREVRRDRYSGTGLALLTDYRAVFDPNRPKIIWLGFSDTGLMLSEDGGESIINVISFHRGEVNQAAYWRDKLVRTSGSCVSMAVDPDLSTTVYASICGKNANRRSSVGGIVIKSVDGGWNWTPIYEKHGLDDGIIRSIIIDPSSPRYNRTVYAVSYGNGVYKSVDDGCSFKRVTRSKMFGGNTRLMWLEQAPSDPQTLYLAVGGTDGIRPIYIGPDAYPALKPGQYGGVFKTTDAGKSWQKLNQTREIPSVQDIAVHPWNPDIVYVAAFHEEYLVSDDPDHPEWAEGGVFRTEDGGTTWELVFDPPEDELHARGEIAGICINPIAPEIMYAAVKYYGIYRTLDGGATWDILGQASMDRMQRRYHSIDLNPHNPVEVWVAHFGSSFTMGIDYVAQEYLQNKLHGANFLRNSGFEELDEADNPLHWKLEQPPAPRGENPVFSTSTSQTATGNYSARFHLTQAYSDMPSRIPAVREQLRLEKAGKIPGTGSNRSRSRPTGETHTWIYQKIDPYFTTLMRGREVVVEVDVFIVESSQPDSRDSGSEGSEIRQRRPQAYLTEVRDYNVHWMVAETSLEDLVPTSGIPVSEMKGEWYHCRATGTVSEDALWLRITVSGIGSQSGPREVYVDNVSLRLVE
ncbi:WD40/YVTN/BNR-like repeat-containing protein [Candidatus Neomarinimicrobiota bacterium]